MARYAVPTAEHAIALKEAQSQQEITRKFLAAKKRSGLSPLLT